MTPRRPSTPARRRPANDARASDAISLDSQSNENAGQTAENGCNAAEDSPNGEKAQVSTFERHDARNYSWPPFQPGHRLSVKAGANSPSIVAERAEQVHAHLLQVAPYLDEPIFVPQVNRYLQAAAIESLIHEYVVAKGIEACSPRMIEQLTAARRLARDLAIELGLSPRGRAELATLIFGAERAEQSLDDLIAEGGRIRRRAEARLAAAPDAVPDQGST